MNPHGIIRGNKMSTTLPREHVLDLIHSISQKPANTYKTKKDFINKHAGKWAVIRQEHINGGKETINHIESVHHDISEVPFDKFSKNHILHPVSDIMASHGTFLGHEKFL